MPPPALPPPHTQELASAAGVYAVGGTAPGPGGGAADAGGASAPVRRPPFLWASIKGYAGHAGEWLGPGH